MNSLGYLIHSQNKVWFDLWLYADAYSHKFYNYFLFLDLIAIPDFGAGAMENWGLITYRETSILYDSVESSSGAHQWVAVVVAHELAHQVRISCELYFGKLCRKHLVLDPSGLATWLP